MTENSFPKQQQTKYLFNNNNNNKLIKFIYFLVFIA